MHAEPGSSPRGGWTNVDVMATALSMIPSERLHADDELWVSAWGEILGNREGRSLLPALASAPVPPAEAIRDEVEELRRVLLRAGFAGLENPTYNFLTLRKQAKEGILALNSRLVEEHATELKAMAAILTERLAVRE
jgi:hypothetical protein